MYMQLIATAIIKFATTNVYPIAECKKVSVGNFSRQREKTVNQVNLQRMNAHPIQEIFSSLLAYSR